MREYNLKFVEPMDIKPGTDWEKRREIRRKEREIDRWWCRFYRAALALEIIVTALLVACITHCEWILQIM